MILEYGGQYTSREVGETTHHGVSTLELELTKHLELDVSFIWDRVAQPKADANGIVSKPDDFRLTLSLDVDFSPRREGRGTHLATAGCPSDF